MVGDGIVTPGTGFLTRLARSKRAATLPMMAAAVIPLVGMLGGGLDLSRLYIVKTRLQHACDAGALAGRRTMGGGTWTQSSNLPQRTAVQFFDSNIEGNAFGATVGRPTFTETAGRVTGNATATVPMTLMRVFGYQQMTLTATCDAEMRLPNTDVMFVLDTTGSMGETLPGDTRSKINALKFAVKCFYEEVARLDTEADCTPGTPGPTGGTGTGTQIRFGFVPYATNVNVGGLLPASYFADQWTYQSRVANYTTAVDVDTVNSESYVYVTYGESIDQDDCGRWGRNEQFNNENTDNRFTPNPSGNPVDVGTNPIVRTRYSNNNGQGQDWSFSGASDTSGTYRTCRRRVTTQDVTRERRYGFTNWTYRAEPLDISAYKTGSATFATGNGGSVPSSGTYDMRELATLTGARDIPTTTFNWDGCIEERQTVRQASYTPIPSGALDLDIDLIPSGTAGSKWGPTMPGGVFLRGRTGGGGTRQYNPVTNTTNYINAYSGGYYCPTEARKLQTWTTASSFQGYVNGLTPNGNTYHDIGLIWGARFISPTGIFASENALTSSGGEIERHLIFMTDGETCTGRDNYQAYGISWWDRRQTSTGSEPTDGCDDAGSDGGTLSQQVNARFTGLCEAVRNKNITLWVIYFGSTDEDTVNRMTACATAGRFYYANNSAALVAAFRSIAAQISQLRLTS